jgi:hypothetical protein
MRKASLPQCEARKEMLNRGVCCNSPKSSGVMQTILLEQIVEKGCCLYYCMRGAN